MPLWRFILVLCLSQPWAANADDEWRVGSFQDPGLAPPFHHIIAEAYGRVGLKARFEPLPLVRAEVLLRAGELDADLVRSEFAVNQIPQALRIRTPIRTMEYFGLRPPPCPARLERAELAQLRIALPRGSAALDALLPPGPRVPAADPREALRYVQGGMADLAAIPATPIMRAAAEREGLCAVAEPLALVPLFHVIQARHAAWLPRLDAAFAELERNGFMARVWREAEREFRGWQLSKPPAGGPGALAASAPR